MYDAGVPHLGACDRKVQLRWYWYAPHPNQLATEFE